MTQNFIEHVNITVGNPARTARMLIQLFDWQIRWQGRAAKGGHTVHVGNEQFYMAVYADELGREDTANHKKGAPLNHIGIVVDDLDEVEHRVVKAGLIPHSHHDYDPGRRFYFFDSDHIEYEVISYGCALAPIGEPHSMRRATNGTFRQWLTEIAKGLMSQNGFRVH